MSPCAKEDQDVASWVQYGGTEQQYDAVDMGPAAVLELRLKPRASDTVDAGGNIAKSDMTVRRLAWPPLQMFCYVEERTETNDDAAQQQLDPNAAVSLQGALPS